jgi:hypothetical protein
LGKGVNNIELDEEQEMLLMAYVKLHNSKK